MINPASILASIRHRIGPPPRSLGWFKPSPFAFPEPPWMAQAPDSDEPLKEVVRGLKSLWKHGVVVWGHVVKANARLFEEGDDDCPATLVYSATAPDSEAFSELPRLVEKLHQLRESPFPNPSWTQRETEWWDILNDDMSYHRGFKLPEQWLCHSGDYKCSLLLIHRPHLPEGRITSRCLPILVDPVACIAQVVPSNHWPEGLASWLNEQHGIKFCAAFPGEWGESIQHLAPNPAGPGAREEAYSNVFGPIQSVFHEMIPSPHHIDVYHFHWPEPRAEHGYVTGGMSDAIQPGGGDFGRIELAFYTKEHHERFPKLLRSFARYPWETGNPIHPFDTVPLGDHAASILGADRFRTLLFLPGVAKPESAIHEAAVLQASQTRLLSVVPITDRELNFKLSHDLASFLDLLKEKRFDLAYHPGRAELI